MLRMELGREYRFTLQSQKSVVIIIHGTRAGANGMTEFDITVNGVRGSYADVNAALGDAYIKVERV
jgi:hypothetical protein